MPSESGPFPARHYVFVLVPARIELSDERKDVIIGTVLAECDFDARAGHFPRLEENELVAVGNDQRLGGRGIEEGLSET